MEILKTCENHVSGLQHGHVKQAEQRLSDSPHITFVQGDAGNLPMVNETYDLVFSLNGFHAFSEMERGLKHDGIFTGCFYIRGKSVVTDFLVDHVLSRKGWFTPLFQTEEDTGSACEKLPAGQDRDRRIHSAVSLQ